MGVTSRFRPVVVGLDGSPSSTAAFQAAVGEAHRRLRPLRIVRVLPPGSAPQPAAVQELEELRGTAAKTVRSGTVDLAVRAGPADLVLADESHTAALLVLAASPVSGEPPGGFPPAAATLVRTAGCPLLLHRPAADASSGVVVGGDGSPGTADVIAAAAFEACLRSATLAVVVTDGDPSTRRRAERRVADLRAAYPSVPVELRSAATALPTALVAASRGAGLVVVGRTGDRTGSTCDTATTVAARAGCPVLVVPSAGSARLPDRGAARRSAVALTSSADQDDPGHRLAPQRRERRR